MKILSLNMWIGGKLMDAIIPFLQREDADIVTLTEVHNGHDASWAPQYRSLDVLREALHYPYEAFSPTFCEVEDFGEVDQGNAVLSKLPITHVEAFAYDIPYGKRDARQAHQQYFAKDGNVATMQSVFEQTPRNLQHVTIDAGGRDLHVFNTQGPWGTDGLDNPTRLYMAEVIVDRVGALRPVVLTGDFNVQEQTRTIGLIEGSLTNVFKGTLKTSFNMTQKKGHQFEAGFAQAVVDMMFVTPDVRLVKKTVYSDDVSDHLAMSIEVEI